MVSTVNLEAVEDAAKTSIISGITTNPSILSKVKNVPETLHQLLKLQAGPVAVQVTSPDVDNMVEEGKRIFGFSNRLIIKVPVTKNGLIAIRKLHHEKIPVLGTGIFHPTQALLATNYGAVLISPYFNHIGDIGNANEVLKTIASLVQSRDFQTKILVASLKSLEDLIFCALIGVDAVTIKDVLYYKLVSDHHSLEKISQKFLSDWKHAHGDVSIKDLLSTNKSSQK